MRTNLWKIYLLGVVAVAATYFLSEVTSLSKLVLYNGIGLIAVIAVLVRDPPQPAGKPACLVLRRRRDGLVPHRGRRLLRARDRHASRCPYPSIADAFYLGMYPLMIIGLIGLLRTVSPGRDVAGLVDAGLVAVATFAVLGILVMDTYVTDDSIDLSGRLISLAYPVMDVALVAVAARLVAAVHLRQSTFALMTVGLFSLLIADTIYGILNSRRHVRDRRLRRRLLARLLRLHRRRCPPPVDGRAGRSRARTRSATSPDTRLAVLFLVVLAVPLIDLIWGEPFDKILTIVASMIMFSLVLVRLMGLMSVVQSKEQQARHDARHDALTGLANRVLFGERVENFVNQRKEGVVSVLFVDLDDFKFINDSLGHQVGDDLLVAVAARLSDCVRANDLVARLSGDEFAVLLESAVDRQDAVAVAQRVQDSLEAPVLIDDREIMCSASVGIAVERRSNIERAETILRAADVAMYRAKSKGKGRFEFFEQGMHLEAIERLDLKTDLQVALERGQFELNYQPIVEMHDREGRAASRR